MDLCAALGWQATEQQYRCSPTASVEQLLRFHTLEYIDALRLADEQRLANKVARETFNIGTMENPVFAGVFERAATTVGGSILAAELAFAGNVVFHPAGGTHHGRPDRASGFCYFNDPVFALTKLDETDLREDGFIRSREGLPREFLAVASFAHFRGGSVFQGGRVPGGGRGADAAAV